MNYYIINDGWCDSNELYHYGIKGMKWGVRRYQNPDGSLTAAGKKKAKQEYKEDNEKAFELGKEATVYGHATAKSMNRTIKIENKLDKQYEKDPEGINRRTQALRKNGMLALKHLLSCLKHMLLQEMLVKNIVRV